MVKETQIQLKLTLEEKDTLVRASRLLGLGHSSFARAMALEKARSILKENKPLEVEV